VEINMKYHILFQLLVYVLLLCCFCEIYRPSSGRVLAYRGQAKDNPYHVHQINKERNAVTGKAFTNNFKMWTHDEDEGTVDVDEIALRKQTRRQRMAALARASFYFLENPKEGSEVCSSVAVPSDTVIHVAYHFPELDEDKYGDNIKGSKTTPLKISVQEHLLGEHFKALTDDDDYAVVDGSFPVESFTIIHKMGTIHHETEAGGSVEVCVTGSEELQYPFLVGLDITTGKDPYDDHGDSDVEDEMMDYEIQLEDIKEVLNTVTHEARSQRKYGEIFTQHQDKMHKVSLRWPVTQICVLIATGFVWLIYLTRYFKKNLF